MGIIVHIGQSKTGTTTQQNELFANHKQIYYLGRARKYTGPLKCRNSHVYDVLAPAIWHLEDTFNSKKAKYIYHTKIAPEVRTDQVILGSWEGLSTIDNKHFKLALHRLRSIFGEVKILVSLRSPLSWLRSEYLHAIKSNYVKRDRKINRAAFIDFNRYLLVDGREYPHGMSIPEKFILGIAPSEQNILWELNSFTNNISFAIDFLGQDNVCINLYEQLKQNPRAYYKNICDFMKIDLNECLDLTAEKYLNLTIDSGMYEAIKRTESSIFRKLKWILSSESHRRRYLKANASNVTSGADSIYIEISNDVLNEVRFLTRHTYQRLDKLYELNLGDYEGYLR